MYKISMTRHSPAVARLPRRTQHDAIVIHHFGVDRNGDGQTNIQETVDFFTKDPEGLATIALPGKYSDKLPTIRRWRESGPPYITDAGVDVTDAGVVPYHFLVDAEGRVARVLPIHAKGPHAGRWNDRSVAVCFLGVFNLLPPLDAQLLAGVATIKDIRKVYPRAMIWGHDDTLRLAGEKPKGCPGAAFPLEMIRRAFT